MTRPRPVSQPLRPRRSWLGDFDEQPWAAIVALSVLAGVVSFAARSGCSFHDPRWLYNAWFRLAAVGAGAAVVLLLLVIGRGASARRLQLCLLLSLLAHVGLGLESYRRHVATSGNREVTAAPEPAPQPEQDAKLQIDSRDLPPEPVDGPVVQPVYDEPLAADVPESPAVTPQPRPAPPVRPLTPPPQALAAAPEQAASAADKAVAATLLPPRLRPMLNVPTEVALAPIERQHGAPQPEESEAIAAPAIPAVADPHLREPQPEPIARASQVSPSPTLRWPVAAAADRPDPSVGVLPPARHAAVFTPDLSAQTAHTPRLTQPMPAVIDQEIPTPQSQAADEKSQTALAPRRLEASRGGQEFAPRVPRFAAAEASAGLDLPQGSVVEGKAVPTARRRTMLPEPDTTAELAGTAPHRKAVIAPAEELDTQAEERPTAPRPLAAAQSVVPVSVAPVGPQAAGPSAAPRPAQLAASDRVTLPAVPIPTPVTPRRAALLPVDAARTPSMDYALASVGGPGGRSGLRPALEALDGAVHEAPAAPLRDRDPVLRAETARRRGGTAGTERAVETGLACLARFQFPDGRWCFDQLPPPAPHNAAAALGQMRSDTAATGLALMTFLGAGYTQREPKYQAVVGNGLRWLAAQQKPDGDLFTGGSEYVWLYSHAIGTIAVCEAYAMTHDPALRDPARRAVAFIVAAQSPTWGGWRYQPQTESDTSVSGWQLMALKSAQMAGLEVPDAALARVQGWLDRAAVPEYAGGLYAYNPYAADTAEQRSGRVANLAMSAEGLLMRLYLGWPRSAPGLAVGADYFNRNLPELGTAAAPRRDAYYWYYATQVMFHIQGPAWQAWNDRLHPLLESMQEKEGPFAGSWDPLHPVPDRWAPAAGRHYVTAMSLLMLEVYYRHLPLFRELTRD